MSNIKSSTMADRGANDINSYGSTCKYFHFQVHGLDKKVKVVIFWNYKQSFILNLKIAFIQLKVYLKSL